MTMVLMSDMGLIFVVITIGHCVVILLNNIVGIGVMALKLQILPHIP